jgi:hypothetical protein
MGHVTFRWQRIVYPIVAVLAFLGLVCLFRWG